MTRRTLLLVLLVVAAIVALLVFTRSGGGSSASSNTTPTPTPAPTPGRGTKIVVRPAKPTPTPIPKDTVNVRRYAVRLLPIVSHATTKFDAAVRAARRGGIKNAAQSCNRSEQQIGVQQDLVDGVAHPYVWYSSAGLLHRHLLGIYHDMVGAALNCATTASNGDQPGFSQSISDMTKASRQLHAMAHHLRRLSRQPH